jgi:hypothetical protein
MQGAYEACLGQPQKSVLAEHKFETGPNIKFDSTTILDKALGYMEGLIKEAVEIRLHQETLTGKGGFILIWS